LDTNKVLSSPSLPSSIINRGKGFEYHNSKRSFRTFFKDKESPFSKINIHCDIIYGPNDKLHKFVNKTICEIIDNDKNITLYNPYLIRNFLYIDDFLSYINNLLKSLDNLGPKYTELFLSSHEFNSLHEFILTIKTLLKSNVSIKFYKGNPYKRTNEILKLEFDYGKNPKWLNLNKTLNLSSGLKKVIDRLLEARSK
jgi:nucleoside-diphosphate-sugar epimerase